MYQILIVEDNPAQLSMLEETIRNAYPTWNIHCANNYEEALHYIEHSIFDHKYYTLFLLDIQLTQDPTDRGGYTLAEEIRKNTPYFKTPLLFLTAVSDDYCYALSNFHCYNYISKPYTKKDILFQLHQLLLTGYLEKNSILFADTNRIQHQIFIDDIYYIEVQSHTLTLHTKNGTFFTREYSLDTIALELGTSFLRCHKKLLINKQHLSNFDKTTQLVTVLGQKLPVGRTYLKQLDEYLTLTAKDRRSP